MTAEGSAAYTYTPENLGFVAYTNLAKLDTGLENGGEILNKITEVNTPVCRKIEQHLIIVKGILAFDKLHFETVLCDFLEADPEGFLLLNTVLLLVLNILRRCLSHNRLKRLDNFIEKTRQNKLIKGYGGIDKYYGLRTDPS